MPVAVGVTNWTTVTGAEGLVLLEPQAVWKKTKPAKNITAKK